MDLRISRNLRLSIFSIIDRWDGSTSFANLSDTTLAIRGYYNCFRAQRVCIFYCPDKILNSEKSDGQQLLETRIVTLIYRNSRLFWSHTLLHCLVPHCSVTTGAITFSNQINSGAFVECSSPFTCHWTWSIPIIQCWIYYFPTLRRTVSVIDVFLQIWSVHCENKISAGTH